MKAVYHDNTDKGPGFGLVRISDAPLGTLEGLSFSLRRGSDQGTLGPGGWQSADYLFGENKIVLTDEGFAVAVGPEIVNCLDPLENYRITLHAADGSQARASLRVPEVRYSLVEGGRGIGVTSSPEPKPAPPPPAPEVPAPPEPLADPLPLLEAPPAAPKRSLMPVFLIVLLLLLAAGGFAVWKFFRKDDTTLTAGRVNASSASSSAAAPPAPAAAPQPAPSPAPQPVSRPALAQAHEHLAGKAEARQSVALGKRLREDADGQDAAFLLFEDAAQKGDAEAMLLTGGFYDPASDAPSGSIQKSPGAALHWYRKAEAAGQVEATARLVALRVWAEHEAAKGSPDAKRLLERF